ncbi:ribbon-helix-helix domain-containing protein [Halorussus halophilus]|uniref:ribbon-helix-helix domain-containing protein n=1 Tax=Halorussus halophilus TaxID=2650975 RepID=UPI0013017137|nr:ribbon-helix-helix domain-containing protein [Halorussus halophilus]
MSMDPTTVRFPDELLWKIEHAYGPLGYQNSSELIRAAVRDKLQVNVMNLPPEVAAKVTR